MEKNKTTCTACKGTGVKTDENGIQYDDCCPVCEGAGTETEV